MVVNCERKLDEGFGVLGVDSLTGRLERMGYGETVQLKTVEAGSGEQFTKKQVASSIMYN